MNYYYVMCCYHSVKDNKSESKSQPVPTSLSPHSCCYHSVKDNKSESKSQQERAENARPLVVIILSKIINLKANHNTPSACYLADDVVIILSKIINLKANHN